MGSSHGFSRSLATLLALAFVLSGLAGAAGERIHLVVLHTNDVHGQVLPRKGTWLRKENPPLVGGLPRVAACIHRLKAEAEKDGAAVLVVDAGDWFQGTPEGLVDDGLGFVNALAKVGYDALCIGNHDFDHGIPNLVNLLKASGLPAVAANLEERGADRAPSGKRVAWVPPWRIVERAGLKIALVGLVTPITPEITHPDAQTIAFVAPAKALERVELELKGKADLILPLAHEGVEDDHALARAHPELPLIVGGHSHTFLKEGEREGATLIVQTGGKASTIGRVDLWVDQATKKVVESRARLIDLDDEPADGDKIAAVEQACAVLVKKSDARMSEVVGELTAPLERAKDQLTSSTAGNFLADAVRTHAVADVGLMNRGGIRADVEAGKVTRRAIFELVPFDNNVTVLTMTGAELFEMLRRAIEGKAHSGLEVSGVVLEVAVDARGNRKLAGLKVGGQPLDRKRVLRVAMNSFMADGGDAYVDKAQPGPKRKDDLALMRDVVEEVFAHRKKVAPNGENRYAVTRAP